MNSRATVTLVAFLLLPSTVLANPTPVGGPYGPPIIALLAEASLIALILGCRGFDPIRLFYTWGVVTLTTFLLLVGGFYAFDSLEKTTGLRSGGLLLPFFVCAELLIVVLEAIALRRIARLSFFQRKKAAPLTFIDALSYSIIVNAVSFFCGLLL